MKKVAVGIITRVVSGRTEYLLISATKDFGEFTGFYYPSGGHVEDGESDRAAVIREIKEELGITVNPITRIAETDGDVADQTTYWWLCSFDGEIGKVQTEEIADVRWFTKEDIVNEPRIWPATRKVFMDYIFNN